MSSSGKGAKMNNNYYELKLKKEFAKKMGTIWVYNSNIKTIKTAPIKFNNTKLDYTNHQKQCHCVMLVSNHQ